MRKGRINVSREVIEDFCRRNSIRRLALFGSVLGDDFGPGSDVDVLVVFEPGARVGLRFFEIEQELSKLIGRNVDLNTPNFLSHYFREQVLSEAELPWSQMIGLRNRLIHGEMPLISTSSGIS